MVNSNRLSVSVFMWVRLVGGCGDELFMGIIVCMLSVAYIIIVLGIDDYLVLVFCVVIGLCW